MFYELIATIVAGIGAAGLMLGLVKISGGRLPRWLVPIAAGAGMIGMTIWSEYSWYGRTVATLPQGVEVAEVNRNRALYRPWTFLVPLSDRFVALDTGSMRSHEGSPGLHIADMYLMGRWQATQMVPVLVDCPGQRRALFTEGAAFRPDGAVEGALWTAVPESDPVLKTACRRG